MMHQLVRLFTSSLMRRLARPAVSLSAGAGLASILSYQAESDLAKPEKSAAGEYWGEVVTQVLTAAVKVGDIRREVVTQVLTSAVKVEDI